ncbi:MAG: hypothetical protein IM524_11400 [Pseudanabaena sp. M051S1SP1A06QC]|nr:hypothetical protein [Pseudanabaena sp. M051S1SP1A06QC]
MFYLSSSKVCLYVPNCPWELKDSYDLKLQFINTNNLCIDDCKYLVQATSDTGGKKTRKLSFFLVHDIYQEENYHKLFLQKYLTIEDTSKIKMFLIVHDVQSTNNTSLIDLTQILKIYNNFKFEPFSTVMPVESNGFNLKMEIKNLFSNVGFEFKDHYSVIFSFKEQIHDDDRLLVVKKGVHFSLEKYEINDVWLNLSGVNFSRSVKSIKSLKIPEPIDHSKHKFVNIKTGSKLPIDVKEIKQVRHAENFYETFSSDKAIDKSFGNLRFSQGKYYFEQTNLESLVKMIDDLHKRSQNKSKFINFDSLGNVGLKPKIIHTRKKFVFANRELYYTPAKGLHHCGVLVVPSGLKLKLLISKNAINEAFDVIKNINERIKFLYKNSVGAISQEDIIVFDYENFTEQDFLSSINDKYSCLVHLNIIKEDFTDINSSIIKFLKRNNLNFTLINQLEKYTIANALLKLVLKKGAIPWKINFIDHEDFNHIFIGVDLGHDHSHRSSNLTIIAINNQGLLLSKYQKLNLPISENIPLIELRQALKKIFNQIPERLKQNLKMTIHRDGNFHELSSFQEVMLELGIKEYNLVEVIKSDVPIIGFREQNHSNYIDGFTGYYLYKDFLAYLVTNDQSLKQGTSPSPLKIKKIIGYKSIHQIVEEIFWLTKAYSINIFESTKLPITTLLANNFAYTRSLIHFTN